ncbi:hypothetical protein PspLS_03503, partial [Pyricularia sp. CBS 133598]
MQQRQGNVKIRAAIPGTVGINKLVASKVYNGMELRGQGNAMGCYNTTLQPSPAIISSYKQNQFKPPESSNLTMTRSHKANNRNHAALANGTALPEEHIPKYFAKHGFLDNEPKKVKKNGGGRSNWGNAGEEVLDENFTFAHARRRSNSSSYTSGQYDFKTKFDVNEPEPVFEESMGAELDDEDNLAKTDTSSSNGSINGEDKMAKSL